MLGGDRKNEQKIKERLSLQTSSTGSTALHIAARYGRISVMKCILGLWPTLQIDKLNSTGKTALMCASLHGQNDAVKLLLENGSRALITNKSDQSPLHLAARSRETGSSDVIKTLLEAKLDPGLKDADGYTPLLHAVATENIPALEVLIPVSSLDAVDNKGRDALLLAIEESAPVSEDLVKFLVSKGAEVKGKTYHMSLRGGGEWLKDYIAGEGGEVIEYSWLEELMRRRRFR
ncbi:uncharacterized protein LAJ45_09648 [Morchella importuna]|uniref:uncharacterized protein n=1 Tax=Morchella importuna TaxID=1174673 RepID=UPI001E8CD844|nr:uncharacterized protein LAJ45_09648 [Morchella importuna]KAH8146207.1 hypothetical protein LAJ45_09648 [Morchella importuna]